MTAQKKYITSLLSVFSTFLESNNVSRDLALLTTEKFVVFINMRRNNDDNWVENWSIQTLEKFLTAQNVAHKSAILMRKFITQYTPLEVDVFLHEFLASLKSNKRSNSTIKNYRSDIQQFSNLINCKKISQLFEPENLRSFVHKQIKSGLKLSTVKRKLSSISQFALWAENKKIVKDASFWISDIESLITGKNAVQHKQSSVIVNNETNNNIFNKNRSDSNANLSQAKSPSKELEDFLLSLEINKHSQATIKNYKSDINQFLNYSKKSNLKETITQEEISKFVVSQRKLGLKANSIKRKLSSISQFALWAESRNSLTGISYWIHQLPGQLFEVSKTTPQEKSHHRASNLSTQTKSHSQKYKTPVLKIKANKLVHAHQKGIKSPKVAWSLPVPGFASDNSIKEHQSKVDKKENNTKENQKAYSGIRSSLKDFANQINKRRNKQFLPYLNLAMMIVFVISLGILGYQQFITQAPTPFAYPTSPTRPNRELSFQGRLTDTAQNPITSATDMAFRLYDNLTVGTQLWSSGTCSVTPDQDGIFSVGLGDDCGSEISENVFTENSNVWLEVEIAAETLTPRQSIKTVAYALNSETVQGYPVSATGAATINTILVMDDGGQVLLGEVSPTLKSTTGTFSIEAQALTLQTTSGSDGDIILDPDGLGEVLSTGYFSAPGATFSATYAGGTSLVLKGGPSGTANIQEWQDSTGTVLGVVDESGNMGIGTNNPSNILHVKGTGNIGLDFETASGAGNYAVIRFKDPLEAGVIFLDSGAENIVFRKSGSGGLLFDINGNPAISVLNSTRVGIGATSASAKLHINGTSDEIQQIIQAYSTQTNNLTEWQDSSGAVLSGTDERGVLFSNAGTNETNLFVGNDAGNSSSAGISNSAIGNESGTNLALGSYNSLLGERAGHNISSGSYNTASGFFTGANVTTGSYNAYYGSYSGIYASNGSGNIAQGYQSFGFGNNSQFTGSDYNVISGYRAGYNVSDNMDYNVMIGYQSGYNSNSGSNNVYLGKQSGYNETGSNKLYIENTTADKNSALIYGEFDNNILTVNGNLGIGTTAPSATLDVNGDLTLRNAAGHSIGSTTSYSSIGTYQVGTITAASGFGRVYQTDNTISASANSDGLQGYRITPTFSEGAYTGVSSISVYIDGTGEDADLYVAGNVGIGSTSPNEKLDVAGNIQFSGSLEPAGLPGTAGQVLTSAGTGVAPTWGAGPAASSLAWDDLTAPDANLSLAMSTYTTGFNWATGTSTNDLFSFTTDASANGTGSLVNIQTGVGASLSPLRVRAGSTDAIFVQTNGNVGIGTTVPAQKLDVAGSLGFGTYGAAGFDNYTVSVTDTVFEELTFSGISLDTSQVYRVTLATWGTGTNTGYVGVVWYDADVAAWQIREVSKAGTTSNHPYLVIDSSLVKIRTDHVSPYSVAVTISSSTGDDDNDVAIFGADSMWQRSVDSLFYDDGSVGIGTTTPGAILDVKGTLARIQNAGDTELRIDSLGGSNNNSTLNFRENNSDRGSIYFDGSANDFVWSSTIGDISLMPFGSVGIGTTIPVSKLDVRGDIYQYSTNPVIEIRNVSASNTVGLDVGVGSFGSAADGYAINTSTTGSADLHFGTNNTIDMTILYGGNVGIGTTTPGTILELSKDNSLGGPVLTLNHSGGNLDINETLGEISFKATDPSGGGTGEHAKIVAYTKDTATNFGNLGFFTNDRVGVTTLSEQMTILSNGNIGIGTTAPEAKLDVNAGNTSYLFNTNDLTATGTTNNVDSILTTNAGTIATQMRTDISLGRIITTGVPLDLASPSGQYLSLTAGGTERMRIDSTGNVGIGTTNPKAKLDIYGSDFASTNRSATKEFSVVFANGVANQKFDIYMTGSQVFWGSLDVEIVSSFNNQNASGSVKKTYGLGLNAGGTIYTNESRYSEESGATADNFAISDITWDATNSRYKITIVHRVSTGNTAYIKLNANAISTTNRDNFLTMETGSVYTTDTTVYDRPEVNYNGNLGIGGQLLLEDGTFTAPSLSFRQDTNTGIYRVGADTIGFAANGTEVGRIESNGYYYGQKFVDLSGSGAYYLDPGDGTTSMVVNGNVGIGTTTTPSYTLDIRDLSSSTFRLAPSDNDSSSYGLVMEGNHNALKGFAIEAPNGRNIMSWDRDTDTTTNILKIGDASSNSARMTFLTQSGEAMRIDENGNVGIGTSSPDYKLDVSGAGSLGITNKTASPTNSQSLPGSLDFDGYGWDSNSGSDPIKGRILFSGAYSGTTGSVEPYLSFSIQGSGGLGSETETLLERMRITNSGDVAIGNTLSEGAFDDESTHLVKLRIGGESGTVADAGQGVLQLRGYSGGDDHVVGTLEYLDGRSNDSIALIKASRDAATIGYGNLRFYTSSGTGALTEKMRIDSNGNVGIGTTAPSGILEIQPSQGVSASLIINGWNTSDVDIDGLIPGSTVGSLLEGPVNAHTVFGIRENDTDDGFYFISGGGNYSTDTTYDTVSLAIKANGYIGIGTSSPSYQLDVVGSTRAQTNAYIGTTGAYFYSDASNRITTPSNFYVTASSPSTYLYSANTYLGGGSGDNLRFRANEVFGDYWRIASGTGAFHAGSGTEYTYNRFGSGGTANYAIDGSSDLYIQDELEVDGLAYFGNDVEIAGSLDAQNGAHVISTPWNNFADPAAGNYMILSTPIVHNEGNMFSLNITGYAYNGGTSKRAINIQCVGYAYTGSSLINSECRTQGTDIPVEINTETRTDQGSNEVVVVYIGNTSTNLYYEQMTVSYNGWQSKDPDDFKWSSQSTPTPANNNNNVYFAENSGSSFINSGNLGIGSTSPTEKLDINITTAGGGARLGDAYVGVWDGATGHAAFTHNTVKGTSTSYALLQSSVGKTYLNSASGQQLSFRINNTDEMVINTAGNVGIGTSSPAENLHIYTNDNNYTKIIIENPNGGANHQVGIDFDWADGDWTIFGKDANSALNFWDGNDIQANMRADASAQNDNGWSTAAIDYGEFMEKIDHYEDIQIFEIVGVKDGKITKNTNNSAINLVTATDSGIRGGNPFCEEKQDCSRDNNPDWLVAAFIGQVPVLVDGPVNEGDYIVPSGNNDGKGVAVSTLNITPEQFSSSIGKALEDDIDPVYETTVYNQNSDDESEREFYNIQQRKGSSHIINVLVNANLGTPLNIDLSPEAIFQEDPSKIIISKDENGNYITTNIIQNAKINSVAAFANTITANLKAGLTTTQELIVETTASITDLSVETLTINNQPIADYITDIVNNIGTTNNIVSTSSDLISPIDNNTAINIATDSGSVIFRDPNQNTIADISDKGNLSLLGNLVTTDIITNSITATGSSTLGSLLVNTDATISGELTTDSVTTNSLLTTLLETDVATSSSITTNILEVTNDATISGKLTTGSINTTTILTDQIEVTSARITALEAGIAELEHVKATTADIVTATVSGTLYAESIYANSIYNFEETIINTLQQPSLLDIIMGVNESTTSANLMNDLYDTVNKSEYNATTSADLDLKLSDISMIDTDVTLTGTALFIEKYFKVNGAGYISDSLAVGNSIFTNNSLVIGDENSNTTITTGVIAYTTPNPNDQILKIQPDGQGSIELLAGLVNIDASGSVTINGDLDITGNAKIAGTLLTDLVKPTNFENPLQVQVAGIDTQTNEIKKSRFEIINEVGTPVATFSAQGDAEFAGDVGVKGNLDIGGELKIESQDLGSSDTNELSTDKTSGKATIKSGANEVTIKSSSITNDTLIYVTAVGSTDNQVIYVKSQAQEDTNTPEQEGEFIVGFDNNTTTDVSFNWWIVN